MRFFLLIRISFSLFLLNLSGLRLTGIGIPLVFICTNGDFGVMKQDSENF